jgi:hypothetical protein
MRATAATYALAPCWVSDLKFEHGFCGERFDSGQSPLDRAPVAPTHDQTLKPDGYLEIAWFGKMHYISPALYAKDAEKYHELHWKEAWLLLDSVKSNRAIFDEWANPTDFFGSATASSVEALEKVKAAVDSWVHDIQRAPKPDVQEFVKLEDRTYDIIARLAKELNDNKLEADKVAKDGLDLEQIRQDSKRLLHAVDQFRNNAIDSAQHIQGGLETAESTAFQILNVVPTLTFMDPFREAAYKISVLLLRASARGVGGYTAWGTKDGAMREAFAIIRSEAAGVIVDVVLLPVNRLCAAVGMSKIGKHFCTIAVQQIIEFECAYYKLIEEHKGRDLTNDDLQDLFYDRCASLVGALAGLFLSTSLSSKNRELLIKSVASSVLSILAQDYFNARKAARDQNREILEVMMADLPGTLMRVIQASIVGLIQRRAAQAGQQIEQQRATRGEDGTTAREAAQILAESDAADWSKKGTVSKKTLKEIQRNRVRNPVKAFTNREYNNLWQETNLDYSTAQAVRRYADNNNLVIIAMDPADTRRLHTDSPEARGAKAPKPMDVKAKTSNHPDAPGEVLGLVAKPVDQGHPGGPTHKDYAAALKMWNDNSQHMFDAGYMVRSDGVVFHPDQLARWAQLHSEAAPDCQAAIETLNFLKAKGYHDLTNDVPASSSGPGTADRLAAAQTLLATVRIGYYSDLDLVEVVDFTSGNRRFMGDKGETKEVMQLARDNREHANESWNIHDYDDPELPDDVRSLAKLGDAAQHGGNAEVVTLNASKKIESKVVPLASIHMVFPDGEIVHLNEAALVQRGYKYDGMDADTKTNRLDADIRTEIEAELRVRLQDKYQDFANRAEGVRKHYQKSSPRFKVKGQKPPPVTSKQLADVRIAANGVEILDEPGLGQPVTDLEIYQSLAGRKLSLGERDFCEGLGRLSEYGMTGGFDPVALKLKYGAFVAVDFFHDGPRNRAENLVIAIAHYHQTLAEAVASLFRTRAALGNLPADVQVWYEIYTAYRPVASGYVRDRIGGPDPGVNKKYQDLADAVSCFGSPNNEKFFAFATTGFADAYTPKPPKEQKDPDVPPGYKKVFMQGGYAVIPDDSPKPRHHKVHDPRPFQGLLLTDVWDHLLKKELDYRPTTTAEGFHILIMPTAIYSADYSHGPLPAVLQP